jgi:SMI1-KNR4 cell-wall
MWRELIQGLEPEATFFPAATSTQIAGVEAALRVTLPDDLKNLLTESNGVHGAYGLGLIWSLDRIQASNQEMRAAPHFKEMYMPFDSLLFFADAGNGDQFAFRIIQGAIRRANVFAWNHEDDSRTWAAPSLEDYLEWWLSGKLHV